MANAAPLHPLTTDKKTKYIKCDYTGTCSEAWKCRGALIFRERERERVALLMDAENDCVSMHTSLQTDEPAGLCIAFTCEVSKCRFREPQKGRL